MKLERTTLDCPGMIDVIVTAGMIDGSTGEQIFGVFADEADAASDDADRLALGTVGADAMTAEQIEMAERNSERLAEAR